MSALAALVVRDGEPAEPRLLRSMLSAMPRQGPDGVFCAADAKIAVAQALLDTTGQPAFLDSDQVCIAIDGFLTDRDRLAAALATPAAGKSDAELILLAYTRWREGFTEWLLGEFIILVWDKKLSRLYAVRDHFGVKPLYYAQRPHKTYIGSDQLGLLAAGVPNDPDPSAIVHFLAGLPTSPEDTNFKHIKTLPPGHILTADASGLKVSRYWALALPQSTPKRADAPGELRQLLTEALFSRTRTNTPPAFALSGGLDSSSLACLATRQGAALPVHTFSMTYEDGPNKDEREFIDTILQGDGFAPSFVNSADIAPFGNFNRFLQQHGGPPIGPNTVAAQNLYAAVSSKGFRVLIGGHGGDEAISYGNGRLLELAERARYIQLWSQIHQLSQTQQFPFWPTYLRFLRHSVRRSLGQIPRPGRFQPSRKASNPSTTGLLRREIAEQYGVSDPPGYTDRRIQGVETETAQHFLTLTTPLQAKAFELIDQSAAVEGVEIRHPFWDRRVIEFCLSLRSDEKLNDGLTRRVLRKAMSGIVPDQILQREHKFDFTDRIVEPLIGHHSNLIEDRLFNNSDSISPYLQMDKVQAAFRRLTDGSYSGFDFQWVWRAVSVSLWLEIMSKPSWDSASAE